MITSPSIRIVAGQFHEIDDATLTYVKQLGVNGIQFNTPNLPGDSTWAYDDLAKLRERCDRAGLTIESIENVPIRFYDKIMLGLPGRDAQLASYAELVRNLGRAGIPILGHHFMPNFVWRTVLDAPGRAGAQVSGFDLDAAERGENLVPYPSNRTTRIPSEETMWANYEYFLRGVLPAAEEAGVRLALHPDDPPVPMLDGTARLFYRTENFKRAEALADSPAWGLNLCLGCCSEMPGGAINVYEMIDWFGPRGKILYVHFRDVQGTVPSFRECFLGEGNYDPAEALFRLKRSGFSGFLLDDHVPQVEGDTAWGHRARAHAIGYMQGLLKALEREQR